MGYWKMQEIRAEHMSESSRPILELNHVNKVFPSGKRTSFAAVKDVTLTIERCESIGIVGESGCGKSTLARMITNLTDTTSGKILLDGTSITGLNRKESRKIYQKIQMVFQDPYSVFSPRMTIGTFLEEGLVYHGLMSRKEARQEVIRLMKEVELDPVLLDRFPHQLSGGQLQRVVIARAISIRPDILILDEATSALDVSVQKQVLALLAQLKKELQLTYLFIGHDLAVVRSITDRIAVMYAGSVVEVIPSEMLDNACHPYTKKLLDSVFSVHRENAEVHNRDEEPDSTSVKDEQRSSKGCLYQKRCALCTGICREVEPMLKVLEGSHEIACHRINND